jgi:TatD DNase family protein
MILTDSHCHLDLLTLQDAETIDAIVDRAQKNAVAYLLNVSVSLASFATVLKTAEQYANVWASVGSHPNEDETVDVQTLVALGQHPKVVAIGETGLDYFRETGKMQTERFIAHIQAAKTLHKPLIIHTREAKADTLEVMRAEDAASASGVMHCFTEDWETAKAALDMNFYISFSGIVTFKNAPIIQEVAKRVPLDRMLIETDAPYLAPLPHRGKANEPAYVRYTAEFIASLRKTSLEEIAAQTTHNFFTLFKGAKPTHV